MAPPRDPRLDDPLPGSARVSGPPADDVLDLVRPDWPPLRHVRRGWSHLTDGERRHVEARLATVLKDLRWGPHRRDALGHFLAFLAQVETIAIEIPLRALPGAPEAQRPVLRRQLVDEVFHSLLFARLAHELALPGGQPPAPIASAERLLQRIRDEPDAAVAAVLLNLVAEAWIETLFHHARKWGVADAAFDAVLADEERHVEEAMGHIAGLDPAAALPALRALERGLIEVGAEPAVALAMLDLAGEAGYRALAEDLESNHRAQLAKIGVAPDAAFDAMARLRALVPPAEAGPRPVKDTPWRQAAREVWGTPRDPTMQGAFDVRVGHVPKRLLLPVTVAAIGRAYAKHPRLNRIVARGQVWQLPRCNVGVRVLVADDELATVVVTDADRRSVKDIARLVLDGHAQLVEQRERRLADEAAGRPTPRPAMALAELAGPTDASFAVALSNAGKFGLQEGAGAFSGALSPSTDITMGQRRRQPAWFGVAYLPAWQVNLGCLQDHRVFDGREAALAMNALREELSPKSVRALLKAPDTLPAQDGPAPAPAWMSAMPPELRALPAVGLWKYTPVVVGGAALGAALGVGGWMLYQNLATGAAAAGATGAGASSAVAGAPAALATAGPGGCHALVGEGLHCSGQAGPSGFCAHHAGR